MMLTPESLIDDGARFGAALGAAIAAAPIAFAGFAGVTVSLSWAVNEQLEKRHWRAAAWFAACFVFAIALLAAPAGGPPP